MAPQINWNSIPGAGYMPPVQRDEDALKKVKRTIGWYNHNGGLAKPIIYKDAKAVLEAIDPQQALRILGGLKEKGAEIRDPTAWIKKAAQKHVADLDPKIKKTVAWYNKNGNLAAQIHYDSIKGALSSIPPSTALKIMKGLEEKGESIRDPTRWLITAAQKAADRAASQGGFGGGGGGGEGGASAPWGGPMAAAMGQAASGSTSHAADPAGEALAAQYLEDKLVKTMQWYNRNGGLQQPLDFATLAPLLSQLPTKDALMLIKGLDNKGPSIGNPTGWVAGAITRKLQQGGAAAAPTAS